MTADASNQIPASGGGLRGHFGDRLLRAIDERESHVVIGLDPSYGLMPPDLLAVHEDRRHSDETALVISVFREFLLRILDVAGEHAVAVKPQLAYFENQGGAGYALYEELVTEARSRGLLVIADAKRGDIGTTARAYAAAHLGPRGADAVTVNPWFGFDGVEPFLDYARSDRGAFLLVKTSNPSSAEVQDVVLRDGSLLHERVADLVRDWGEDSIGSRGYSSVGAVVGATHPERLRELRLRMPGVPLLIPGYGAQGAQAADAANAFDERGTGAVVNSSRGILYAYRNRVDAWPEAAAAEAEDMRAALWSAAGRG